MKISRTLTALAFTCAATLVLSACSASEAGNAGDAGATAAGDRLSVVATTTQLADFTAAVGGDDIELTSLLAPGGSAHHFDPTPKDLLTLGEADVLVVNGAGLDEFIDSAIEASGFSGTIIDASSGIDLDAARAISAEALEGDIHEGEHEYLNTHGHSHGPDEAAHDEAAHDHEGHSEEGHSEEDHAEHDHAHDHGDLNPHIWTSLRFAQGMVQVIADDLVMLDQVHAQAFLTRAGEYNARLVTLDEWIATQFARVPVEDRVLVTGHDSLRYYLHDYGIAFAGSLLPSFEDNAEPSAAEIDALIAAIRESGVKAIFVESSLSPKLAQTIAKESGAMVIDADSIYADSLGPEGSGAETYIAATVHNTKLILDAWGATVDPLPAGVL